MANILIIGIGIFLVPSAISTISQASGAIDSRSDGNLIKNWTHEMELDSDMIIKWNSDDPIYLTMEISAPTRGYVGVGFSRNGGMTGADIVLGWVTAEGIPMIKDYHGLENGHPIEDSQQDYELIAGSEREDRTTIQFRRKWDTCDEHDMAIEDDTMRLIWAWHENDPEMYPRLIFPWHDPSNRGVRSLYMRHAGVPATRFPDSEPDSPENKNIKTWDITFDDVLVNALTTYVCKLVKFPAGQGPKHITGFRPLIEESNREHIHHITLYHCSVPPKFGKASSILERFIGQPDQDCFNQGGFYTYCMAFALTWIVGSEGELLPQHVGLPLGDYTDEPTYFKVEIHYDNPNRRIFYDNSGLRIFYTEKLRQYDAGTVFLGHRISPFHLIPGSQPSFTTYTICSDECTQNAINLETGIKAMSVVLHGHKILKKIKLRHIRNGVELEPIASDNNFDFNYQQFRTLKHEPIILPGDTLMVDCISDTTNRGRITFGGSSSDHEMCQAIMLYYPKTNFSDCRSQPEFTSFLNALNIRTVKGKLLDLLDMPLKTDLINSSLPDDGFTLEFQQEGHWVNAPFDQAEIIKPVHLRNQNLGQYIRDMNWNDSELVSQVEQSWRNGNHYMFCSSMKNKIPNYNMITKIPKFLPFVSDERPACRFLQGTGNFAATNVVPNYNQLCTGLFSMFIIFISQIIHGYKPMS